MLALISPGDCPDQEGEHHDQQPTHAKPLQINLKHNISSAMLRTQGVCFAVAQHADAVKRNGPCGLPHPLFVNCIVPFRECSLATFLGEKSMIEGPAAI